MALSEQDEIAQDAFGSRYRGLLVEKPFSEELLLAKPREVLDAGAD
jgi:hypothetical protein